MASAILLLLTSGLAATHPPAQAVAARDSLADAIGRTHALHRVCAGPRDDLWRGRMKAMLDAERATLAQRSRMIGDFNLAYAQAAHAFPSCTTQVRVVLRSTAREGRDAALRLAAEGL